MENSISKETIYEIPHKLMMRPNYMEIKKEDLGSWNNYSDAILPAVILLNPELRGLLAFNSMSKSCN